MKALVKYEMGAGNVEVRDVPEPTPGPGQVKIKVMRAGVCGSDVHEYHANTAIRLNTPVTMGHESIGEIVEVGEGVRDFEPGDRVTCEVGWYVDRTCDFCREGYYNVCINREVMGYFHDGCFAEYFVAPQENIVLVPDTISWDQGALIEPLACACHCCYDMATIKAGDVVLVIGPGPVGLLNAQVAKSFGTTVIVAGLDVDVERLAKTKDLGMDYAVNVDKDDYHELIMSLTKNYGVDVVLECTGTERGINMGLAEIKKRGSYVAFGLDNKWINFDIEAIQYKEIRMTGSMASRNANWRQAIRLIELGKVDTLSLAETGYSIYEWEHLVELFDSKKHFKLIIDPSLPDPNAK